MLFNMLDSSYVKSLVSVI